VTANKKECYNESLILRVDSIDNATYQWFKRTTNNDSVSVSVGPSFYIPNLAPADTGRYICKVVVNNGCLVKIASYVITGFCNAVLPVNMMLAGTREATGNNLSWKFSGGLTKSFYLQRSTNSSSAFTTIKTIEHTGANSYNFFDNKPPAGTNFYRVKAVDPGDNAMYSNTQNFKNSGFQLSFYPNPVNTTLYVSFSNNVARDYQVDIYNSNGQLFSTKVFTGIQNAVINYPREPSMKPGIYLVSVTDVNSKENEILKVIFR
jgi:hypothetical protein